MVESLLPLEDAEAVEVLARSFKKRGIALYTGTKASGFKRAGQALKLSLEGKEGGKELEVDQLLVVVGRAPNTEGIGLAAIGLKTERGLIPVGDHCQTAVSGGSAIGD